MNIKVIESIRKAFEKLRKESAEAHAEYVQEEEKTKERQETLRPLIELLMQYSGDLERPLIGAHNHDRRAEIVYLSGNHMSGLMTLTVNDGKRRFEVARIPYKNQGGHYETSGNVEFLPLTLSDITALVHGLADIPLAMESWQATNQAIMSNAASMRAEWEQAETDLAHLCESLIETSQKILADVQKE